ncbi:uncharacterized protein [Onthophagus taurus]|uniref:uncharacterized protein n=1 Tax=Onthophagus taurus TaxID=166361 RepID=UPI000C209D62|nr:uncharacterized protein LOC111425402 [Onthophagus taurus]
MAIPFAVPGQPPVSPERLRELYDFLQQLLIVRQQQNHHRQEEVVTTRREDTTSVRASGRAADGRMLSALSDALHTSRRPRRRWPKSPTHHDDSSNSNSAAKEAQNQRWKRVGTELRKIADEFESAAFEEVDDVDEVDSSLPCCSRLSTSKERKGTFSKILSMPVMVSSICTAVLCVGWHLLRNR